MTERSGRRVRVLHLRSLCGGGGGPEETILAYAAKGGPPGFDVSVCYLRNRDDPEFTVDARASAMGVDYHEIRERGTIDVRAWRALRDVVSDLAPEVLHCHDYKANLLGFWLSRRQCVALLATAHGWVGTEPWGRLVYYPADRLLLSRFPCVVAVSHDIRKALLRSGARPENVVVVRNSVDAATLLRNPARQAAVRRSLGLAADAVVLGFVGRLDGEKRLDLLIEAAVGLFSRERKLAILIVGEGRERTAWSEYARRLGVLEICRFVGRRDDVPMLHHAMDVYVQPSLREGTSIALLEAMAMETPVVATAVGGTADVIEDGAHGLLVPPGDARALEGAIGRVLLDPDAAASRARAARRRVETELSRADWEERMSAIYRGLLTQRDTCSPGGRKGERPW